MDSLTQSSFGSRTAVGSGLKMEDSEVTQGQQQGSCSVRGLARRFAQFTLRLC